MCGHRRVMVAGEEKWRGCASEWGAGTWHSHAGRGLELKHPNQESSRPSLPVGVFTRVLLVTVNTHRKYAGRGIHKELNQELQRTKDSGRTRHSGALYPGARIVQIQTPAELSPAGSWDRPRGEGQKRSWASCEPVLGDQHLQILSS